MTEHGPGEDDLGAGASAGASAGGSVWWSPRRWVTAGAAVLCALALVAAGIAVVVAVVRANGSPTESDSSALAQTEPASAGPGLAGPPGSTQAVPNPAVPNPAVPNPTVPSPTVPAGQAAAPYRPPPANAGFDYQINTPYQPPAGIGIVSRDSGSDPAPGLYNICYVNAFQAQPDALGWWQRQHRDLLLVSGGRQVVDQDWNEALLDISTATKRAALLAVVGGWIDGCAAKGFAAVEPDNLDSWTRSDGRLTEDEAVAYARELVGYAHARGLAVAQKNTVELAGTGRSSIGFDFAIAEDCAEQTMTGETPECQGYLDAYGDNVIVIEYEDGPYQRACRAYGGRLSVVRRDRNVLPAGAKGYVAKFC